ncbi:protein involved in polysaccharide export, contains SLBB domain of the beta-grasp fold [Marinobacter sp. LV10R510-11A]|uniref:SLBB domain-containing protein n=1 Tax=Marinobacter sp. LV10R510-11A TaxID=1415568 RepID=UPI000BB94F2E|nr:SLBB domain-containing protein [Marinobacter sp. LV10R510-11A]SOB74536.1 protein involved in polysaccharide export, contains SLBB domain of the beta-grasp fold [Marinobacter sp. LV10R510-11A]
MNPKSLLFTLLLAVPLSVSAQSPTSAQIDQFKSLPKAQQEALARQYGVDLNQVQGSSGNSEPKANRAISVVEPLENGNTENQNEDENKPTEEEQAFAKKNNGLQPFGYDLFEGKPSTFAPVTEVPVPMNYTLGPGDQIRIQLWGNENRQFALTVSRNGTIDMPERGPITVAGLSFQQARDKISKLVAEQYIGVKAAVSLGELRSMRVFVLGETRTPGSYSVSSLSTITNALYVSGGIRHTGSLRNIQLKRNGKVVHTLDLYDLLLKGDTSGDARLQAGDAIFIPAVGPRVGIDGEVYRPALYEIDGATSLQELVNLAGGMTAQAYPQITRIERTNQEFLRIIAEADLTSAAGKQARVKAGDLVSIASIADVTGQYIEITGAATRTGKFAWVPGMRVSSVIRKLDVDLLPMADTSFAAIVRTNPETRQISVLSLELKNAVNRPGSAADLVLQEKDQVLVFADNGKADPGQNSAANAQGYSREALFEPIVKRLKTQATPLAPQQTMTISGPVRYPGEYPLPATGKVKDAIVMAGGLNDSALMLEAELARRTLDENGVERTRIQTIDLANAMNDQADIYLQSRDRLMVKSIPLFGATRTVTLKGEVLYPGEYTFSDGETLVDILQRAGGLTNNAFPRGVVFTREKLRVLEAQRLREAEQRLQGDLLGVQLEGDSFGGQNAQRVDQVKGLLDDVQSSRPVGRMVIDLQAVLNDSDYQSIRLQDGDTLTVPIIPQAVSVFGEVQFPTSHLHVAGLTVDDYLDRSGGPTRQADENRVYVVKADGSVMLPEKSAWFGGRSQQLQPGDTVIMPIDVDRLNQLELWTNVSQIVYQMALGAAAVGNL